MRKIFYLIIVLLLTNCNNCWLARIVELGNNFALVESDESYIEILYSYNRNEKCFNGENTAIVVSSKVTAYNYNDRWIIAESNNSDSNIKSFWIIDKDYNFSRLGYYDELKKQTIGPLDSIQFQKELLKYKINLKLKSSKK